MKKEKEEGKDASVFNVTRVKVAKTAKKNVPRATQAETSLPARRGVFLYTQMADSVVGFKGVV